MAKVEKVATIVPDGGAIDKGDKDDRAPRRSDNRPETIQPAAGTPLSAEGGKIKLEGERGIQWPGDYYNKKTVPTLRKFIDHLEEAEQGHYNEVTTALSKILEGISSVENQSQEFAEAYTFLKEKGGQELADSVAQYYLQQTVNYFAIISSLAEETTEVPSEKRLDQERAVLLYAEFLLARFEETSPDVTVREHAREFNLVRGFGRLGISPDQREKLSEAFHFISEGQVQPYAFTQLANEIAEDRLLYTPVDVDPSLPLAPDLVEARLHSYNNQLEAAHRKMIKVLDSIGETGRQESAEVNLIKHSFSGWDKYIAERLKIDLDSHGHIPSKYYINGCLGNELAETKIFGFHGHHKVQHTVKLVDEKVPVRSGKGTKDKLEQVQALDIAIFSAVYKGEYQEGRTRQPGESRPKEFFEKVLDVQVWGAHLNSADKIENFMDQLKAAEAVVMQGPDVTKVLGIYQYEAAQDPAIRHAQFFRIPIMNHRGEPSYLVLDKKTLVDVMEATRTARESFRKKGERDDRYKVTPQEERHKAFKLQLRQNDNTPESWVDHERDFIFVEDIAQQRLESMRAKRGRRSRGAMSIEEAQLKEALDNYRDQVNDFNLNFCRISRYKELAAARLADRKIAAYAPDYGDRMREETNAIALEHMNMLSAFKVITSNVRRMSGTKGMEQPLAELLAKMDIELEIQMQLKTTDRPETEIRRSMPSRPLYTTRRALDLEHAESEPEIPEVDTYRRVRSISPDSSGLYEPILPPI